MTRGPAPPGGADPLPIDPFLPGLAAAAREAGGFALVAEPGAGKTTRAPRALLDAGLPGAGEIWVSQPRRLAARLAAARVADELGEPVGRTVGYQVRFDTRASRATRIRFVTEGVLARRLAADPALEGIAAVLLDELHERHLDADLSLALLRAARAGPRPDLVVGAMSATMEAGPVAAYLGVPVVSVPGRPFDVAIEHDEPASDRPLERRVAAAVRRLVVTRRVEGDVLVFLPGAAEIRRAAAALEDTARQTGRELVVLHGELPAAEQDRAVRPGPRARVVLSTNVAETSVTLPRVVAVVDSGLARVARQSPWSGVPTLETARISRSSAAQRAGRAGRVGPGLCLRLYTRADHDGRPLRDDPEIRRADLAGLVLGLRALGHDPRAFPFLDAPPAAALDAADALLARLGAVTDGGVVTDVGRRLLRLPVPPRLGRVLLEAARRGVGARGCLAVALLGERDVRRGLRGAGLRGPAGATVDVATGPSDVLARVEAFEAAERAGLDRDALRAHDLDGQVARAAARARRQLEAALERLAVPVEVDPPATLDAEDEAIALAVLAGFPDRVALRRPGTADVVFGGGGAGRLAEESEVREAPLVVAVEARRGRGGVVVTVAQAIEPEHLLELFPERLVDAATVRFDRGRERVVAEATLSYDGLVLERTERRDGGDPAEVARCLAAAVADAGLHRFVDADALEALRRRVAFAAAHLPAGEGAGPRAVDDALVAQALADAAVGCRSFSELRGVDVLGALHGRLDPTLAGALERLAPTHVPIPGRRRVPVEYPPVDEVGTKAPAIASRMQDFFGALEGPRVAGGRVPVVLHLLAPNRRAVQVTPDLAGFWERHWPTVRRELARRYPRHAWPEDPRLAAPSRPGRR